MTTETFAKTADRLPEVMQWLADRELPVPGAPFLRYLRVTGEEFEVEAGIPTIAEVPAEGDVFTATLPAGQYAVELHEGSPDGLAAVTDRMLAGTARFDRDGDRWGARLETYFTDPAVQPDRASGPRRWRSVWPTPRAPETGRRTDTVTPCQWAAVGR